MPATEATAAKKPRRKSTAKPVTRKRHDPAETETDGFERPDMVLGQRKGFKYGMLTPKDAAKKRHQGYRRVERAEGAPRPIYWSDEDDSSYPGYRQGELTLYEIPEERHAQLHARAINEADKRMDMEAWKAKHGTFTNGAGAPGEFGTRVRS